MSNSNKESIFIQSGANSNVDLLSATSEPNWTKVSTGQIAENSANDSKKVLSEINHLLSEVRKSRMAGGAIDAQDGGAKKKKAKSKSATKQKKTSTGKKMKRPTPKKEKKAKKSKSKSAKKQHGSGKGSGLMNIREVAKIIVAEVNLKDGIPMNTIASKILKQNDGNIEKAGDWVRENKSKVTKMYNDTKKEQDAKREAKKAEKAAKKAQSSSGSESE